MLSEDEQKIWDALEVECPNCHEFYQVDQNDCPKCGVKHWAMAKKENPDAQETGKKKDNGTNQEIENIQAKKK